MHTRFFSLLTLLILFSCTRTVAPMDPNKMRPPYKLLNLFSRKIKPETGLTLTGYAYNLYLPDGYQIKNGIGDFALSYSLMKNKDDEFSLDYARNLIVLLGENLLQEINSNSEVRPDLDVYPFTSDRIKISVYFVDDKRIELGQGVANVYFARGKIEYEKYDIEVYGDKWPAEGKHHVFHEETYAEALDIVKKKGTLRVL